MPIIRPCLLRRRLLKCLGLMAVISLFAAAPVTAEPPLKVALLPIVDSLPFYVAQQEGYFQAAGVEVVAVKVASAVARDQLMQTGQVDGMLNEIISAANFNRVRPQVQVVSVVRRARPGHPLFRLLAAPGRQTPAISSLAGVAVGISRHTVIEYVTDRLLASAGLDPQLVRKQSVPSIPERYQLLIQGQLAAATLPDPLAMSAVRAGAVLVADDTPVADYSLSILTFSVSAIESRPEEINAFIDSWHRAAAKINADPQSQRALMLEKIRIPPNVRASFRIPPFARHLVPTEDQWQDAMHWMQSRRLLDVPLPYRESVTDRFISPDDGDQP
jgi:NitT/TauT family transport system substrate-binding protein